MAFSLGKKKSKGTNHSLSGSLEFKRKSPAKLVLGSFLFLLLSGILNGGLLVHSETLKIDAEKLQDEVGQKQKRKVEVSKGPAVDFVKKIKALDQILENHRYWSPVFTLLEASTLKNVEFNNFSGSLRTETLELSGRTERYLHIAEELVLLEQHPLIESVEPRGIELTEQGVEFSLEIKLKPTIWDSPIL